MSRRTPVALATAAVLVLSAGPAHAFRMIQNTGTGRVTAGTPVTCTDSGGFAHWTVPGISFWHNTAGQGSGKATALQNAMAVWTNVSTADHALSYAGTTSAGYVTDGQNSIVWAFGNGCTGDCLAQTALVLQSGQVIVEADITFNSSYSWSTDGSQHDTQTVATHELGHALGIHHTDVTGTPHPTMYVDHFGVDGRSLENDDRSALTCADDRYCLLGDLEGEGFVFGGQNWGQLNWTCLAGANVDVFRDGVKIVTTANDNFHSDRFAMGASSANYWVCEAGSTTWYDPDTCTNVITLFFS